MKKILLCGLIILSVGCSESNANTTMVCEGKFISSKTTYTISAEEDNILIIEDDTDFYIEHLNYTKEQFVDNLNVAYDELSKLDGAEVEINSTDEIVSLYTSIDIQKIGTLKLSKIGYEFSDYKKDGYISLSEMVTTLESLGGYKCNEK